ncbi:MAG: hypothetical protein AB1540_05035 [Bdellovibrionota bacterium]
MKNYKRLFLVACLFAATSAFAEDTDIDIETESREPAANDSYTVDDDSMMNDEGYSREPASVGDNDQVFDREPAAVQRSEAEQEGDLGEPEVGITNFALRPSAGAVFFNDTERFAGGLLLDVNVLSSHSWKVGPATGAIFSSVGGGGDFFDGVSTDNEAFFFQIPANLKVTFAPEFSKRLQLGVHGGANVIYTGEGLTTAFGDVAEPDGGDSFNVYPNVGADIDYALGTNADLTLRPDVTFLADFNMVTATIGLALKL